MAADPTPTDTTDIAPPRIVLLCPARDAGPALLDAAGAGDVCAIVVTNGPLDGALAPLITDLQARGVAVLGDETTHADSTGALDGTLVPDAASVVAARREHAASDAMVVAGPVATRHEAMLAGEAQPDAVLLAGAAPGDDVDGWPSASLDLARWWADLLELPAIAVARTPDDAEALAATGIDFLAFGPDLWAMPAGRDLIAQLAPAPISAETGA